MKGQLFTETFDYDGGRHVTVYVPSAPVRGIIYCGDGQIIPKWAEDTEGTLTGVMVVGTHRLEDEMERLKEYTPIFDALTFGAHERFFLSVRDWANSKYGLDLPRDKTAIYGMSAGGELALAMGTRYSDIFGAVLCASPGGGYKPPSPFPTGYPRTYLVAGRGEQFFWDNAKRWNDALEGAGVEVVFETRDGEHGGAFWRTEFPTMVAWALGD